MSVKWLKWELSRAGHMIYPHQDYHDRYAWDNGTMILNDGKSHKD